MASSKHEDNGNMCRILNGILDERRMNGWVDGWMDGWIDGWMDGWIDGWMDGWIDGWMDGQMVVRC